MSTKEFTPRREPNQGKERKPLSATEKEKRQERARFNMAKHGLETAEVLEKIAVTGIIAASALGMYEAYAHNEERINPSTKTTFTPDDDITSVHLGQGAIVRAGNNSGSKELATIPESVDITAANNIGWAFPKGDEYRDNDGRIMERGWITVEIADLSEALESQNADGQYDEVIKGIEKDGNGVVSISGDLSHINTKDGGYQANSMKPYDPEDYYRP